MSASMFASCLRHSKPDNSGRYESRAEAETRLKAWRTDGGIKGTPQVFKCPVGGHWHIGRKRRYQKQGR